MTLDFTRAALADLQAIRDYTLETWGRKQEEAYLNSLWGRFEEILTNPEKFRSRPDLFPDCQIAAHNRHIILFRVRKDVLQIVRILHSAMDIPRHIPKKF